MTAKPRLRLVDGVPVPVPSDRVSQARLRFGREFAHEPGGNFLRHPEPVLSRWSRGADYYNLDPHQQRPSWAACHFKKR